MSCGQTLLFLPCNDNKLHKQKLAISSTPSSAKLDIGDGKLFVYFYLYMEVRVIFEDVTCVRVL